MFPNVSKPFEAIVKYRRIRMDKNYTFDTFSSFMYKSRACLLRMSAAATFMMA